MGRLKPIGEFEQVERIFLGALDLYIAEHTEDGARARLAKVGTVWEQTSQAQSDERTALREMLPGGCRWLRFPALTCSTLWPFGSSDPRPEAAGLFEYSDTVAARVWREQGGRDACWHQIGDTELFDRYMELSNKLLPDPQRTFERDQMQWRQRDLESDVAIAPFLIENPTNS